MDTATIVSGRPRTLEENKVWLHQKLNARTHPLDTCDPAGTLAVIDELPGLDGASWAARGRPPASEPKPSAGDAASGDETGAAQAWHHAHAYYFIGRFPTPNHPAKLACAVKEREMYLKVAAARKWDMRRVVIPFAGRPDEGREIAFYYRRPAGIAKPPVVALWGGIDAWKEQLTAQVQTFLDAGIATIALDNPGTGESPVVASIDAERMFVPVFDWARAQPDLDGERIGLFGRSFGGYWATKLAHVMPDRIAGAVSWAGGAHHMFQREWIEASRYPDSYLMDLAEARGRMLGADRRRGYVERFALLSLLDQGILEKPCAPLLLCNGKFDKQCPVEDIYAAARSRQPEERALFPGRSHGPRPRHRADDGALAQAAARDAARMKSNWLEDDAERHILSREQGALPAAPSARRSGRVQEPIAWRILRTYPLPDELRAAFVDDDVAALYRSGTNPYLLRAHCIGVGIPEKVSLAALHSAGTNRDG